MSCGKEALLALTWFRERRDIALIGRGLGISQATSYRYLDEAIDVLAAQAPDLHDTLARGRDEGWSHVVLDGKVVATDRLGIKTTSKKGATIDAWYSGKTRDFGGNIQALPRPDGLPVWISEVEPGSVHDLTAARYPRAGCTLRRSHRRPAPRYPPGRPRLPRRWNRRPHPRQAAHRRARPRRRHP